MKYIRKYQSGSILDPYSYDLARENYIKEKEAFKQKQKSYNDSLALYNYGQDAIEALEKTMPEYSFMKAHVWSLPTKIPSEFLGNIGKQFKESNLAKPPNIEDSIERLHGLGFIQAEIPKKPNSNIKPSELYRLYYKDSPTNFYTKSYSKPKEKPEFLLNEPKAALIPKLSPENYTLETPLNYNLQLAPINNIRPRERVKETSISPSKKSPYSSLRRSTSGRTTHLRSNELRRNSKGEINQKIPLGAKIKEFINNVNNAKQIADNRSGNWFRDFKWAYKRQ